MLLTLLQFFATKFLVLALHLEAGSFPKPLTAREEIETFAAAGGACGEKILRPAQRPGRPDLHRDHRPDEGGGYLRLYPEGTVLNLCEPLH